jgi:methylenetetrahydrofolate dehydrogenase (NADP+)/methenyltetrahydrofolate cyclohydrolase/formyltetrahydrofolate synthetase
VALEAGASDAVACDHWARGSAGALDLAKSIEKITTEKSEDGFKFLYDADLPIEEKITIIAKEMYGADGIELSDLAKAKIETYTAQVCD